MAASAEAVTVGIMAPTGERAFQTLKAWIPALRLPKGRVHAVDSNGVQLPDPQSWWSEPAYLKYSSTGNSPGDAFMSAYPGPNRGVIFTPIFADGEFRQYGDLPLATFSETG